MLNKLSIVILIATVTIFFSCNNKTNIQIFVYPEKTNAYAGEIKNFNINLIPDELNNGSVGNFYILDSNENKIFDTIFNSLAPVSFEFAYQVNNYLDTGKIITLKFCSTDNLSSIESCVECKINVVEKEPTLKLFKDVLLLFSSSDESKKMAMVINNDTCYQTNLTSDNFDILFAWSSDLHHSLLSPNSTIIQELFDDNVIYSFDNKKNTKLNYFQGSWENLNLELLQQLTYTSNQINSTSIGVTNLSEGDIVSFETSSGNKGLILVKNITKSLASIEVDIIFL